MSYLTTPTSFITVDGTQIAYREMSAGRLAPPPRHARASRSHLGQLGSAPGE